MANLIAKKLSQKPIGTHVELTYGDGAAHHQIVSGVITDSDFSANVEITTQDGEEIILDYAIIRGIQVLKTLEEVLRELRPGTKVRFSYGTAENREPNLSGVVLENDNEENIEIQTSSGEELVLSYALIRSLLVQTPVGQKAASQKSQAKQTAPAVSRTQREAAAPKAVSLYLQEPEDILNANDQKLKETFGLLPQSDRKRLNSVYERFKYGIKINDSNKITEAATQARQILLREDDQEYYWSREAVLFCGYLLRRACQYDHEVFLVGECFEEAAAAAWKEHEYALAGAYAILALLDTPMNIPNLIVTLSSSVVKADDISGLRVFWEHLPAGFEPQLQTVIREAFAAKGIQLSINQDTGSALNLLENLYPGMEMAEEVTYWLPEEESKAPAPKQETAVKPVAQEYSYGTITRLNWSEHTGTISGDNGHTYTFRYQDIADADLAKTIQDCLRADLGGKIYLVKFYADKDTARNLRPDTTLVDRSRVLVTDAKRKNRFETAFNMCKKALGTPDTRRALEDVVKHAITLFKATQKSEYITEALELYEKYAAYYPENPATLMNLAQCCSYVKKFGPMMTYAEKALACPNLQMKQKLAVLANYLGMVHEYYEASGDRRLLSRELKQINEFRDAYQADMAKDPQSRQAYIQTLGSRRVIVECGLDMLAEAEADYVAIPADSPSKPELAALIAQTRARLMPQEEPVQEVPEETGRSEEASGQELDQGRTGDGEDDVYEDEEEILPYTDTDGWDALKLTKREVIDYALSIPGPDRIPAMLAYLRAGAALNPEIAPVYRSVALAANDPMEAPDYSITALVDALAGSDTDYPELCDCCMGAAFLRASFLAGRGYDYSTQGLRSSISISQQIPTLDGAYDILEEFRKEVGRGIDIYADYRNHGVKRLMEELEQTVRHADELYTKFVLTPAREGVKFARLLETKKILFARDGYLASMLRHIMERDQEALEAEKEHFTEVYLGGAPQFSLKHISTGAIDDMIAEGWKQAGESLQLKKPTSTLQGDRRNNLRSNISEILDTICQWYALSEQSAGLTWRTEESSEAYQRLRPRLMEQLGEISKCCATEMEGCSNPERSMGLFLLSQTAKELIARLNGSWQFGQEKYLYADFLRSSNITLNQDFMPELSSTFCALPEFNILARIRRHVEGEKLSFQEQIDRIFGPDKTCNNYGTADRILEYLEVMDEGETVTLPENPERFVAHTELQIDLRYRTFRETYALAINYGQIIKSDAFCYTLENTVRYWYSFCRETRNYGFFTSILLQAENQIHASAQQYEAQLDEQLDALIASNQQYFNEHPDYAEAIRTQIANQNFTVAEDWMSRIRIGDFSLEVQQPEALGYLESFWNGYAVTYNRVADASRPLSALLGRREVRNKDTKRAQQLIDNWLNNGSPSNTSKIEQLLNLLGWQGICVTQYQFAAEPRAEIYEVRKEVSAAGLTAPLHPIAAFGSHLEKKQLYVICLYGVYDCDRLYEKMRGMDVIDGSKIFLLDYALGQADRRALARKLKKRESGLRSVNIVIDRVLISYLADHYNENLINRILMAVSMPFSYCQPYVVESTLTMPPEIFIGRKDELLKIEQPDGVNLIYGGRQLGKSALFKKALADLDGRQQQRAVLVDIKSLDCAAAARKVSTKLIDLNITPDAEVTDDWDVLCRNIERRLRSTEPKISYFLLMLDEADTFINDCANWGYRPLVALKDVQQSLPSQFKYVLAGLHNIVKFNREVALGNNSVIIHMSSLKITPFRTPEAQELLTVPLSYLGFSLPSKVTVSQILATCNYFPGLIQLYAKKLIESIRAADYAGYDIKKTPPYVVSDEHLRRVLADKEFVDQIHAIFEATLTLDQDQGSCYYPLTLLIGLMYNMTPSKSGYTARDVLNQAQDLSVYPLADLDEDKIDALLQELQDLNILRSVSNNSYLLASKNFRDLLGSDEEIFNKLSSFGGAVV